MLQILIASLVLSLIHTAIPNHWLPIIAIGKTEKWSHGEHIQATLITGFAHTLSTVLIGIVVGFLGYKLSSSYEIIAGVIAPAILVGLGIVYLFLDLTGKNHHHHHESHLHKPEKVDLNSLTIVRNKKTRWHLLTSLSIGMFLTPCAEIEAYYFQASTIGWKGIWIVSATYVFITIAGMLLLVSLGMKGVKGLKSHYMEHHEKRITGIVLMAIGLFTYFVKI